MGSNLAGKLFRDLFSPPHFDVYVAVVAGKKHCDM